MRSILRLVALVGFLLVVPCAAGQDVGRVHFLSGESDVERSGQRTPLAVSSPVREGDLIRTGADGHVQLVMVDGARIGLRPKSQLSLERYEFNASSRGAGQALLALLTGTMRVFTGEIVQRDRERYKMKTNLATVGIRGSGNILANLDGGATFNHTLTGAHSVTSRDALGIERTVISYPGQTVQVLPGQAPRHVPTPALIMAAASPPAVRASSEKASETAQTSAAGGAAAAASSGTASTTTTTGSAAAESPASTATSTSSSTSTSTSSSTSTSTSTATSTASPGGALPADTTPVTSPVGSGSTSTGTATNVGTSNPAVAGPQAATGTVGSSIGSAQPTASGYEVVFRFFNPITGGYEGVIGQSSGSGASAVLDAAGRLVQVRDATVSTFLAGPGALPPGYSGATIAGNVAFNGGTHHDTFRSPDGSVILGRWEGGSVTLNDGAQSFDLGPRNVSYEVVTPTPVGILGSFTGTATYSLAAATAPTDAAGHTGTLGSASVLANFSSRTVSGNFGLSINGQSFSLTGVAGLDPGSSTFSFASALQNLGIACSGNCSTLGYLGTMNGQFAGSAGRWLTVSYRLNPNRAPQSGFSDFIVGNIALDAGTSPTIGIVLPQTGAASLVFNGVDASQSFSTFPNATGTPSVTGTLQANFTDHTVSFNAAVSGTNSPTFTASATRVPIVGAGFSASTDAGRPSGVGAMTVVCSGTLCGSSPAGRFDGLFRNSAGTAGIASLVVGDSGGAHEVVTSFGLGSLAAADARAAMPARVGVMSAFAARAASADRSFGGLARIR